MKLSAKPWMTRCGQPQHASNSVESLRTMSAKSMTLTQKASFSTVNCVRGTSSLPSVSPQMTTAPSQSVTTNWPTSIRRSRPNTVDLDSWTMGAQVKLPA